jgi:octaprenyl-diphosphate synthase
VVATVVEMVHMATLVHDDILDDAEVRRRGLTVNAMNGNEAAVMLGDYLISHAYHLCSSLDMPAVSRIIADTTNVVCEGELLQIANRNNWELDEGTYFEIIRRKTASLTGTCCRLGALLHREPLDLRAAEADAVAEAMHRYGEQVGIAFQVVDDLLDLTGEEATVGKSLGRDLAKGKLTLPMIHFLATVDGFRRQRVLEQMQAIGAAAASANGKGNGHGHADVASLLSIREALASHGSIDYARQRAGQLIDDAKACLDSLPDSSARALLAEMADMVLTRKA